ncbi:hypothetical protein BJX70DRAFT_375555 [Aspergillus crustosus]
MPSSAEELSIPRVLHIRRSDEAASQVILHVSQTDSELSILATEGESPYAATVPLSQFKKLRARNYEGTDHDWTNIILHVFGLLDEPHTKSELLAGIETSAGISGSGEDDKDLVITVRKRIQSITQRLGSFTLHQDDEQGIELFEWLNIAIARADTIEQRYSTLLVRFHAAENTINSLNKQLQDFIGSKNEDEQQLLLNSAQLLNEKKLKIRNQQRLLACANANPEKLSASTATDAHGTKMNAKGRRYKRPVQNVIGEPDSDDEFEKLEVDNSKQRMNDRADDETDGSGRITPQFLEDEDKTTDDDDEGFTPAIKASARETKRKDRTPKYADSKSSPSRRELPFLEGAQKGPAPALFPPVQQDPDKTGGETDDDEL